MFGLNPKDMQAAMKKLGIKQEEIQANRVIIEAEGGNLVINNPQIVKINMQGQESFQITGEVSEETGIREDDIKLVMEKTGKTRLEAEVALKDANGDLTEAIMALS